MSNYSARSLRDLNIGTSYANVASFAQTIGADSDQALCLKTSQKSDRRMSRWRRRSGQCVWL